MDIDDLLDEEGWDLLNGLTEEELLELNNEFDPECSYLPISDRGANMAPKTDSAPMFDKDNLLGNLEKMVADSQPVIKNEKLRKKEEERKKQKEIELDEKFLKKPRQIKKEEPSDIELTREEEELLDGATEEELIEAAALLKMNGMLTSDQINSVFAGEKPKGQSIKGSTRVKSAPPKSKPIGKNDEETELDVVKLMQCLKDDTDDLFYVCINNIPKLEKHVKQEVFRTIERSKKVKHVSLAMVGLIDADIKELAKAIRYNEQIETLNLESNVITLHGIEALMKVVARHPSLREIKVSNQKQPFGGNGEECMADAIDKNDNILKFGYSFKNPGPRNKADRAIIRHNENLRQRRRNGEDVYDLKATCKIRDPWPQPWIKVKSRRLLGGLIEDKVTAMGHMIDPDNDTRRESRGPKLRDQVAKPLDINALLAQRKDKLKGTKIADLEAEQEKRRKKHLEEMHAQDNPKEEVKEVKKEEVKEDLKAKDIVQLEEEEPSGRRRKNRRLSNGETLNSDDERDTPPASSNKADEEKKNLRGTGKPIASLSDEDEDRRPRRRRNRREKEDEEEELDREEEEEKAVKKEEPVQEKKNLRGKGKTIVALTDDVDETPRRRRKAKRDEDEEEEGLDFSKFDTGEPNKQEEEPAEEIEEVKETEKEERPHVETKEERKARLSREGGKQIVANLEDDSSQPRRRRRQRNYEDEDEEETEKVDEKETLKEGKKTSITDGAKPVATLSDSHEVRRRKGNKLEEEENDTDPFGNVSKKVAKLPSPESVRRRRRARDEESDEEEADIVSAFEKRKKKEEQERLEKEKIQKEKEEEEKKKKAEEERKRLADIEGRKKKLTLEGGKKIAPLNPVEEKFPRRRRTKQYEEPEEEKPDFLKVEPKKEIEPEPEAEPEDDTPKKPKETLNVLEERKKKLSREGGVKIAPLNTEEDTPIRRRRRPRSPDAEEEVHNEKPKIEVSKTEEKTEDTLKNERKKKLSTEAKRIAELPPTSVGIRRKKTSAEQEETVNPIEEVEKSELNAIVNASKKIKGLEPVDTSIRRRRRNQREEEDENDSSSATTKANEEKISTKSSIKTQSEKEIKQNEEEEKPGIKLSRDRITEKSKKIASLPPAEEERPTRRRRQYDVDDSEKNGAEAPEETERFSRRTRLTRKKTEDEDKQEDVRSSPRSRFSRQTEDSEDSALKTRRSRQMNGDEKEEKEEEVRSSPRSRFSRQTEDNDDSSLRTRRSRQTNDEKEDKEEEVRSSPRSRISRKTEDNDDISLKTRRSRQMNDDAKEDKEEVVQSSPRSRFSRQTEDNDDSSLRTRRSRQMNGDVNESPSKARVYTDEETKLGDRRIDRSNKKDDVLNDIFAGRDNDAPKLSLRERLARRDR